MKRKLFVLILALALVFCFSSSAFAQVTADSQCWIVKNNGDTAVVNVDYTGETSTISWYANGGLLCEWGNMISNTSSSKIQKLTITADQNTSIGHCIVFIRPDTSTVTDGSFDFISVYVTDATKIDISNVKKSNGKVKVTWTTGKSGLYQLQYREKDGSWKDASSKYLSKTSYTTSKLKKGTTYSFRVRVVTPPPIEFYGDDECDEYIYGPWSESISYKVK